MQILKTGTVLFGAFVLSACGGSSGAISTPPVVVTPPVNSGPTWTAGVFQAESLFKDKCAAPRAGTNDQSGSILEENHWLRSWSNDKYLWYSEITDIDPATYNNTEDYFDILKTEATTASGNPRDQFHFVRNTAEYQELINGGSSAAYGYDLALIERFTPRDIRIAFTDANTPATMAPANLARGAKIIEVDGVDVINGNTQADIDTINAALFPETAGEIHTFTVLDVGSATPRTFDMMSEDLVVEPVNLANVINVGAERIGYLHLTTFGTFSSEEAIFNAMRNFATQGVDDLVLDLRYNGGGFLDIAAELGYMIAGPARTNGKDFDNLVFNDKYPTTNPVTGATLSPTPFYSRTQGFGSFPSGQSLPTLNLSRVFLLSTDNTCSASEAVINGLRGVDVEVILIGTSTCGKPYGFYATDNCGTTYFTIQFRGENDKGFGDYADGFSPMNSTGTIGEAITGCEVADDFSKTLGDQTEAQLATALSYRQSGSCPVTQKLPKTAKAETRISRDDTLAIGNSDRLRFREFMRENLILTSPGTEDEPPQVENQ
jgi:hypothetical protein